MANDYLFYHEMHSNLDLGVQFDLTPQDSSERYLVANTKNAKAEVFAAEMNWYFEKSVDDSAVKIEKLKKLYDARCVAFEGAQDVESSVRVGKNVLVIASSDQKETVDQLTEQGYAASFQSSENILGFAGSLGKFIAQFNTGQGLANVNADQVVWFDAPANIERLVGVHDPVDKGLEKTFQDISFYDGIFTYKNTVKYIRSSCLQSNKKDIVCNRCVEICPEKALVRSVEEKQIILSSIQCVGCGLCAGVCPTGALEYAPTPRITFEKVGAFYQNSIPLLISKKVDLQELDGSLQANILPLIVEDYGFLDEEYLLSLLQNSNHPVLIYAPDTSAIQLGGVRLINEIFKKIYDRQVVYLSASFEQLNDIASSVVCLPEDLVQQIDEGLSKRERLSERLAYIIGNKDHGFVDPGVDMPYGAITINEDSCTLCLSCVDACSVNALEANASDNTLRFTPSLCVQCGWCEKICPEFNCLQVAHGQLGLQAAYYEPKIMARDEIFKCVECGKGFAPAKAVSKIVNLMAQAFADDPLRSRALSCCPDCKAKVMLETLSRDI